MDIRLLKPSDLTQLQYFLSSHRPGHIFSKSLEAIYFYHTPHTSCDHLNILGAYARSGELLGVQFFERFQSDSTSCGYGCLFLTSKDSKLPGLGYRLLERSLSLMPDGYIATGVNPQLTAYNKRLGLFQRPMHRLRILNPFRKSSKLILTSSDLSNPRTAATLHQYSPLSSNQFISLASKIQPTSFRSVSSKARNFFENPFHTYNIYHSRENGDIFCVRKRFYRGSYIVKLVDYISSFHSLNSILSFSRFVFSDTACEGLLYYHFFPDSPETSFSYSSAELPEHFSPFEATPIDVQTAFSFPSSAIIQSIDADQDRAS